MAGTNRFFNYGILFLLAFLIAAGGWYLYSKYGHHSIDPIDAIPTETGVLIKFNNPGELLEELNEGNDIWDNLLNTKMVGDVLRGAARVDSFLSSRDYNEFLDGGQIYLAIQDLGEVAGFGLLFSQPYGSSYTDIKELLEYLTGTSLQMGSMSFGGLDGYSLGDSTGQFCFIAYGYGLYFISDSEEFLKACFERIDNKTALPFEDKFEKVSSTSGRNVDANIYVNFERIPQLAKKLFAEGYFDASAILPEFGSWSEIDMLVKNDEVLLNGYTEAVDSAHQYLSLFKRQEPQKIEITRILPYNTALLLDIGVSNFMDFYKEQESWLSNKNVFPGRQKRLDDIKRRHGPNVVEFLTSWVGNEVALAIINPHLKDIHSNTFLAVHAKDIELALRRLRELSSSQYTSNYRDYTIRRISISGLIPVIFGQAFDGIDKNYFTRIEDYIVFANSSESLKNFINIFLSGKTLEQNENFKGFTDNVSDRSNIFCYFNIRNSVDYLEDILASPLAGFISNNKASIKNFEAVAVQFKALNNMYFTSLYVKHNPSFVQEDLSIWKAYLDAPVHGQPYFVKDHRTNRLKIVVFDTINNMYLIDHDGNIVWKLNIGEKVISDVHTIDFYKNGKIQYLFNTENRIYLIDLLGRDVEGYPVDLKKKATNGLAVFDYDNNREYRVLLACDDNKIYNYDIKGKKVDGWKYPLSKGRVSKSLEYLRVGGKDYIIIADEEGNVRITDRRGRARINIKSKLENGINSGFYVNETNSKGILLTTNANGKLTYVNANGKLAETDFGNFSKDHYFLYEDFDNKGGKDFIYLDGNRLTVFDRFKKVSFSWEFENEIGSSPVIIPVSAKETLIGVVSRESGKIYLFDKKGQLLSTPDHVGKTQILIGSLLRDGQLNMIVGSGNTVYNYYFR